MCRTKQESKFEHNGCETCSKSNFIRAENAILCEILQQDIYST